MAADCNRRNPLTRGGTNQGERLLPALSPAYFPVDERDTADLILFAERLSRLIRYYDENETPGLDWSPFFATDIAAVLAGLSALPVASIQRFGRALQDYLAADATRDEDDLRNHFRLVFYLPLLLLVDASRHFERLPREHPLREALSTLMARDAAEPLAGLVAYYRGALELATPIFGDEGLDPADYNTTFNDADARIQLPSEVTQRISGAGLLSDLPIQTGLIQGFAPTGWEDFYTGQAGDAAPYEDAIGGPNELYQQIYDALNYNLLDKDLERLFQVLERITLEAQRYLEASLTAFDGHTPHYALWLAFLRLFRFNQAHLNGMTARHLEYYYGDVLQLRPRRPQPSHVHLLFELNKNVQEHLLPAATTLFRAGKDATKKEVLFQLDADIVLNRAKVESLRALRRLTMKLGSYDLHLPYASPVANSADGHGAALPKDTPKWPPFGPVASVQGLPDARLGFAVADKQLFLREGKRTIHLQFVPESNLVTYLYPAGFKALLTGEKGWIELKGATRLLAYTYGTVGAGFFIYLTGDDPAIVPYDPAIHGEGFDVSEPVLKLEFDFTGQPAWAALLHWVLRDVRFTSAKLQVEASDLRDFTLQNEAGTIDPAKPFLPFGAAPAAGSPLILGSSEVFTKKLDWLKLHVDWEKTPATTGYFLQKAAADYKLRQRALEKGAWQNAGGAYNVGLFTSPITLSGLPTPPGGLPTPPGGLAQTLENEPYTNKSNAGFLKLELNQGFGHSAYIDEKTKALIDLATGTSWTPTKTLYNYDANDVPLEPFTPKATSIALSYRTTAAAPARFIHLHPFGWKAESVTAGRLLPELPNEGELYIGVKDLTPPQRLTLLFQAVDGTANPLKGMADVQWDYLRGNEWVALTDQSVDDKTNNVTGSGIVGIAVPADADLAHTVLPAGLHWLRLTVEQDADALNHLLTIDAQAATATFVDRGNDPAFLAAALPPGTISKLKAGDPAVKKITQPAASFGGAGAEAAESFYIRASERLRHKDRAVTMWDYEHLVLQHFPGIYRAKCINHSALERGPGNVIVADNEVRPGYVLVVTIPNLRHNPNLDPRRPYTDARTLVAIDQFLRPRLSPFVRLEVTNPKLEEVQVKFKVAFTEDVADIAFYKSELNVALIRFLCPWSWDMTASDAPASAAEPAPTPIQFGGKWHKSDLINFVEEQPYVDFVKDFEMYHKVDIEQSDASWSRIDEEVVQASTARSILVSHATHTITEIV